MATNEQKPAEWQQMENTFAEFQANHQDYRNNEHNATVLTTQLVSRGINPLTATVQDWHTAHALAIHRKQYNSEPAPVTENPYAMDMDQLATAAGIESHIPSEWSMPLEELRKKAGIE